MALLDTAAMEWYLPTGPGHRLILILDLPVPAAYVLSAERLRVTAPSRPVHAVFLVTHMTIDALFASRIVILIADGNFQKIDHTF